MAGEHHIGAFQRGDDTGGVTDDTSGSEDQDLRFGQCPSLSFSSVFSPHTGHHRGSRRERPGRIGKKESRRLQQGRL